MTSELKPDLSSFGYADGWYMGKCGHCKETFIGAKRAWSCEPCAIKKSIEPKITRAVPDVPELVRYDLACDFDGNYAAHIVEVELGDYVLYSEAAKIIADKDKEIEKIICALSACQKALDSLVSEESIKNTTVVNAYAMCVDAELKARKALKGESNV